MRQIARNPVAIYAAVTGLFALAAVLLLAGFSRRHSALEYMVAGTLATSVLLGGTFLALVRKRKL